MGQVDLTGVPNCYAAASVGVRYHRRSPWLTASFYTHRKTLWTVANSLRNTHPVCATHTDDVVGRMLGAVQTFSSTKISELRVLNTPDARLSFALLSLVRLELRVT